RSLLNNPKLIIADEPTGNLDVETGLSVMKLLEEIRSEGTAIIMTTHNMSLTNLVEGARLYRCQDGHLVSQNSVDNVAEEDNVVEIDEDEEYKHMSC
ncbi:MAG: phosphonate ABC transporter ATP-binding protein, partial [Bacteroidaceae bacterium]